jgi:inosine-uridine nucleoside N-ribohydrolase
MMIMVALNLTHKVLTCKTKKGNFFNQGEKRQLCQSFLIISQDLVRNNDKSQFFFVGE